MLTNWNRRTGGSLFWLDTLCIPAGKKNLRLRWRAIDSMARIYSSAQSIIILDHELQQTPVKRFYRGFIFGLLFCSAWASRFWTFQEGSMAKEWLVQFDDGICSIDKLFEAGPESIDEQLQEDVPHMGPTPDDRAVLAQIAEWYGRMPRLQSASSQYSFSDSWDQPSAKRFLEIWNNLCLRTTTKKEDLISIVAIMLL